MLISYRKNFLFVHIAKTGGTSIRAALRPYRWGGWYSIPLWLASQVSQWTRPRPKLGLKFPRHAKAIAAKEMLPEPVYRGLFKCAIVRNPWDLQVSSWHHIRREKPEVLADVRDFGDFLRLKFDPERATNKSRICRPNSRTNIPWICSGGASLTSLVATSACHRISTPSVSLSASANRICHTCAEPANARTVGTMTMTGWRRWSRSIPGATSICWATASIRTIPAQRRRRGPMGLWRLDNRRKRGPVCKPWLSPQRPLYQPYRKVPDQIRTDLESTSPEAMARARQRNARIFFVDESAIRSDAHLGTPGGAVCHTWVVPDSGGRMGMNQISAVSPRGDLRFSVIQGTIGSS
jgi:hypothetical protein